MRSPATITWLLTLTAWCQQAPLFRSDTAGIPVDVIVTEGKGRHVEPWRPATSRSSKTA